MRSIVIGISLLASGVMFSPASAWPVAVDCPLVHPDNASLKFIGATLDQHTDGPPSPPDGGLDTKLPDGTIHTITHYASYEIHRDAVLICIYSEIRDRRIVGSEEERNVRIPLPGILMRCEGILHEKPGIEPNDWKRRWCVHDPDK